MACCPRNRCLEITRRFAFRNLWLILWLIIADSSCLLRSTHPGFSCSNYQPAGCSALIWVTADLVWTSWNLIWADYRRHHSCQNEPKRFRGGYFAEGKLDRKTKPTANSEFVALLSQRPLTPPCVEARFTLNSNWSETPSETRTDQQLYGIDPFVFHYLTDTWVVHAFRRMEPPRRPINLVGLQPSWTRLLTSPAQSLKTVNYNKNTF